MIRIEGEVELNKANISFYSEDQDLDHVAYRLSEVRRHYPPPERITRYTATVYFGNRNQTIIDLHLDNQEELDRILECLMELKLKWQTAEKELGKEVKT